MVIHTLEQLLIVRQGGAALEDEVAHFGQGVGVEVGPAVDEAFAGEAAEGWGGGDVAEDQGADVVEADGQVGEEFGGAVDVDFVGLVARVVAVFVEGFGEGGADGVGGGGAGGVVEEAGGEC